MNEKIIQKLPPPSTDLTQELQEANTAYNYCKELTGELDKLSESDEPLTCEDVFRIVLWKTNRYPDVSPDVLAEMEALRNEPTRERGMTLLSRLLYQKGFDLPMASTVLRFLAPTEFQIIDQRVYRLVTPNENRLMLAGKSAKSVEGKVKLYSEYLDLLKKLAEEHKIPFEKTDRIFYEYDKRKDVNGNIPIHGKSTNSQ